MILLEEESLPSQPSGSSAFIRSSIENLTSTPFSSRDSGSAFISQYCFPPSSSTPSQSDSFAVSPSISSSVSALGSAVLASAFVPLGLPPALSARVEVAATAGALVIALVVVFLGLPLDLVVGATPDLGDRVAFFRACLAICAGLCDLTRVNMALADFLGLPTGLLGDFARVAGACSSFTGTVASFRGLPRPLVAVELGAFVGDLVASDLADARSFRSP
jgi:hypothetical protein